MVPGLSARELSRVAGLSPPVVANLERDDGKGCEARTLVSIASVLGTTAEYLLDGEGESPCPAAVNEAYARARAASGEAA